MNNLKKDSKYFGTPSKKTDAYSVYKRQKQQELLDDCEKIYITTRKQMPRDARKCYE